MTRPLVIWGAGGHARVVADIARSGDAYSIHGFLDDVASEREGETYCGARVLGGDEQLRPLLDAGVRHMVIGIGNNPARAACAAKATDAGFTFVTLVHPSASVASDVGVGTGTVIKAMAVVEPGATVGEHVILGAQSYVGHDVEIQDAVQLSAHTAVAGGSIIERGAWIGVGATVKDRVRVGAGAQVGAGAVVLGDIPAGIVAVGNPAAPRWRPGLFGSGKA